MGLRSTDQHAVPLCVFCHSDVEHIGSKNELAWFAARGIDARELAQGLWRVSSSKGEEKMLAVWKVHMIAKPNLTKRFTQGEKA